MGVIFEKLRHCDTNEEGEDRQNDEKLDKRESRFVAAISEGVRMRNGRVIGS